MMCLSSRQGSEENKSVQRWLNHPLSNWWCMSSWMASSAIFVLLVQALGGPTSGDASDSVNTAWAFAHGIPACAYAPGNQFGLPYSAPLYPIVSGSLAALFRIGHSIAFPTRVQMGSQCSNAINAIYHWWLQSGALQPTLELGYIGWLILMVGAVVLIRSIGRGRTRWEPITLLVLAISPSVFMCLHEYFHPQDLMTMGLILIAIALARRGSWIGVGMLIGLALATQQFALLALAPLAVVAPRDRLNQMVASMLGTFALVMVPLVILSSSSSVKAIFAGSGTTWDSGTMLDAFRFSGSLLFFMSRFLPIVASMLLAWFVSDRIGSKALEPVPLIALVAASMSFRLIFEVNFWGYYLMATSVLLVLLDVARQKVRWQLIVWLVLQPLAFHPVLGSTSSFGPEHISWLPLWLWQMIFAFGALALALFPVVSSIFVSNGRVPWFGAE